MVTDNRLRRLRSTLEHRQPDLTVLLENVHKPHNFSAVLRTADAVGLFEAHAIFFNRKVDTPHATAGGSEKWIRVRDHEDLASATEHLRSRGFRLVAAHPSPDAVDYREVDFTRPTAILMGQERDGLTADALAAADERVRIPMYGMVASLNVSVAAAVLLFEAQRQRLEAGLYERCRLEPEVYERTLFEWAYPRLARRCRDGGKPYPRIEW